MDKGEVEDDFIDENRKEEKGKDGNKSENSSKSSSPRNKENDNLNSTISSIISDTLQGDKPEDILSDNDEKNEKDEKNSENEDKKEKEEDNQPSGGLKSLITDHLVNNAPKDNEIKERENNEQNSNSEKNTEKQSENQTVEREQSTDEEKSEKSKKENDEKKDIKSDDEKDSKEIKEKSSNSSEDDQNTDKKKNKKKHKKKKASSDEQEKNNSDKESEKEEKKDESDSDNSNDSEKSDIEKEAKEHSDEEKGKSDKEKEHSDEDKDKSDKEKEHSDEEKDSEEVGNEVINIAGDSANSTIVNPFHESESDDLSISGTIHDTLIQSKDKKESETENKENEKKKEKTSSSSEYEEEESEYEEEYEEDKKEKGEKLAISGSVTPEINQEENQEPQEDEDSVMVTAVKSNSKIPIFETQQSLYSDEELAAAYKKLIQKKTLPPYEMRQSLIEYGRKQSVQHTILEEYDAAQADDDAVNLLLQSLSDDNRANASDMEKQNIKERLDEVSRNQKAVEEKYKEIINNLKQQDKINFEKLLQEQEEERKRFEEQWSNEDAVLPFSKPSSQLLQIRRMQKAMALAHEFPRAKQLKIQADQMQKEEAQIASKQAEEVMKAKYMVLLEKQQRQIECFQKNCERKIAVKECARDAELNSLENTRKQLMTRSTTRIKRPTVTIPMVTSRDGRSTPGGSGLVTQRTRTQYATYKKAPEKSKLDVKPLDVKSIIRPLTPSPRKAQSQRLKH